MSVVMSAQRSEDKHKLSVPVLIEGGFLYTGDPQQPFIKNSWILVHDDHIVDVGRCDESHPQSGHTLINAEGKLILPGLVNPHWHESFVAPNNELADDSDIKLQPYANGGDISALGSMFGFISGIGKKLSEQEALAIARWSLWTQLRSGTTALGDVGSVNRTDALAQAAIDLGMRIRVSRWASDIMIPEHGDKVKRVADTQEQIDDWHALMETWNDHPSGLVAGMPSVVGAFGSSEEQLLAMGAIADQYQSPYAAHLAPLRNEAAAIRRVFGESAIERFDRLGLLSHRLIAIHTAYASEQEFRRLLEARVNICFSPAHYGMSGESTMYETGHAIRWLQQNVPVACSTDGDMGYIGGMPEAMRAMYLGMNEAANDNRLCSPNKALLSATQYGADMLGWGQRLGSVSAGKQADLVFIDINDWRYRNTEHPLKTFLISGSSGDVDSVMIAGRFRVRHGQAVDLDEQQLYQDFQLAVSSARSRIKAD